jgi:hypothetical protein
MRIVVFTGPSCSTHVAGGILSAVYRPPAIRGDIAAAVDEGAEVIVLIDGVMVYAYPPSPMELADALRAGVRVFGCASLGALRSVELAPLGMQGIGWVFRQYASGRIESDDEVVTLCHPSTHAALTVPLVRVRYALKSLVANGAIDAEAAGTAFHSIQELYFEDRSEREVRQTLSVHLRAHAIDQVLSERWNIKRLDAERCLKIVARMRRHGHERMASRGRSHSA